MAVFLNVIGENTYSKKYTKYIPKQPSRRVFNSEWSCVGEYQHEIANHFRDYKNHKKLNRNLKRRRNHHRVIFEEQLCVLRDILPLNRINFPESNSVIYENNFKNCYDNTLRKISTTKTISELGFLTKRQERLQNFKKGSIYTHRTFIQCSHSFSRPNHQSKVGTRNNLGHISFAETGTTHPPDISGNKVIWKGVSVPKLIKEDFSNDSDNYFFHLASECYDEGFLSHIKYLKSIVDRNAINNQISKRRKPRNNSENTEPNNSHPPSAISSVSSSNSAEDLSNSICVGRFASAVKRLLSNPNFPCNKDTNNQKDLKICVNITRSLSLESLNSNRSLAQKPQDSTEENRCIMSDISISTEGENKEIVFKRQHFHDLIENLNNLEISDSGSLPKIVLTDFSTIPLADDNVNKPFFVSDSTDKTIRKQESLEIDVPFFNDYNSEARPP